MSTYARAELFTWLDDEHVCACRSPREAGFDGLVAHNVSLLVNLHNGRMLCHPCALLASAGAGFRCDATRPGYRGYREFVARGYWATAHSGGGPGRKSTFWKPRCCLRSPTGLSESHSLRKAGHVQDVEGGQVCVVAAEVALEVGMRF